MNIRLTMGWIPVLGVPLRVRRRPTNVQIEDNLIRDRSQRAIVTTIAHEGDGLYATVIIPEPARRRPTMVIDRRPQAAGRTFRFTL